MAKMRKDVPAKYDESIEECGEEITKLTGASSIRLPAWDIQAKKLLATHVTARGDSR